MACLPMQGIAQRGLGALGMLCGRYRGYVEKNKLSKGSHESIAIVGTPRCRTYLPAGKRLDGFDHG